MSLIVVHDRFGDDGPAVNVTVGLPADFGRTLRAAGKPIPAPVTVRALIDTGAEVTCLDPTVVAPLAAAGLRPNRFVYANAPFLGGAHPVIEYFASVSLPPPVSGGKPLTFGNLAVIEQPIAAAGFQALLGRDILAKCLLVFDGPSKRFTLAY